MGFESLARGEPERALSLQAEVRARLMEFFRKKLIVTGFARRDSAGRTILDRHEN
jgi:hypothetical protein